jgi:hypothetical protein
MNSANRHSGLIRKSFFVVDNPTCLKYNNPAPAEIRWGKCVYF